MDHLKDPRHIGLCLALVALSFVTFRGVPTAGLADVDTPTVLLENRADAPRELSRILFQEIRNDVDPGVRFYRPVTGLSYAVDQAIFGVSPAALARINTLLHGLCAAAFATLLALLGLRFALVLCGGVLFALHPVGMEVLPAISRRADLLSMLLVLLALDARLLRRSRMAWVLAALAPLAKETAFVLPLLWAALRAEHWRSAGRAFALGLSAMLPAMILRLLALGSLGGYADPIWSPRAVLRIPLDLFDPQRVLTVWGARIFVSLLLIFAVRRLSRSGPRGIVLGVVWLGGAMLLALLGGQVARWYLYGALPAGLLLLCAWADREAWKTSAFVGVALLAAILLPSPLWTDYPEWKEAARLQLQWTEALRQRVEAGEISEGEPVILLGTPMMVGQGMDARFTAKSASVALGYSLRDALELRHGLELPVWCAVQVHVHAIPADYEMQTEWRGSSLAVVAVGAVRLDGLDRLGQWRAGAQPPFRLAREDGSLVLSDLGAPVWRWDGRDLVRVSP